MHPKKHRRNCGQKSRNAIIFLPVGRPRPVPDTRRNKRPGYQRSHSHRSTQQTPRNKKNHRTLIVFLFSLVFCRIYKSLYLAPLYVRFAHPLSNGIFESMIHIRKGSPNFPINRETTRFAAFFKSGWGSFIALNSSAPTF